MNWMIVGITNAKKHLTDLKGLEMDLHRLPLDFDRYKKAVEQKRGELVNGVEHPDSQIYILLENFLQL